MRQVVDLDLHGSRPDDPEDWRVIAREFAQRKAKIDAEAPKTSNRAFRAARRKIDRGTSSTVSPDAPVALVTNHAALALG